jgi:hypothetical protein
LEGGARKLQSRKEQGKKSAVYKNGRRVEDSKLVKERRHDFRKLEEWSVPGKYKKCPRRVSCTDYHKLPLRKHRKGLLFTRLWVWTFHPFWLTTFWLTTFLACSFSGICNVSVI